MRFRSFCTGLTWRTPRMTLCHILWCSRSLIDTHLLRQRGLAECFCLWFELEHDLETQLQVHFYSIGNAVADYLDCCLSMYARMCESAAWTLLCEMCEAQLKNYLLDFSYLIPRDFWQWFVRQLYGRCSRSKCSRHCYPFGGHPRTPCTLLTTLTPIFVCSSTFCIWSSNWPYSPSPPLFFSTSSSIYHSAWNSAAPHGIPHNFHFRICNADCDACTLARCQTSRSQ